MVRVLAPGIDVASLPRPVVALLVDLAEVLATRMSAQGHLLQVVTNEHRGNCPANRECTPGCQHAIALLGRVVDIVERWQAAHEDDERAPRHEQGALWSEEGVAG